MGFSTHAFRTGSPSQEASRSLPPFIKHVTTFSALPVLIAPVTFSIYLVAFMALGPGWQM